MDHVLQLIINEIGYDATEEMLADILAISIMDKEKLRWLLAFTSMLLYETKKDTLDVRNNQSIYYQNYFITKTRSKN